MFPERPIIKEDKNPPKMIEIIRGQRFSFGIQLRVDKVWRYKLQDNEILTVEIRGKDNKIHLHQEYASSDVDVDDKIITATLEENQTKVLPLGFSFIVVFVNGYVAIKPKKIKIKDVIEYVEEPKHGLL